MKRLFTFGLLLFCFDRIEAQNLVPNPSFEDTLPNPDWGGSAYIHNVITEWYTPLPGSADYHSLINPICPNCIASQQMPRTGNAFSGFYTFDTAATNNRECVSVKLIDTLEAGKRYRVEFYVSRYEVFKYGCGNVGAYFSPAAIMTSNGITTYTPQIENNASAEPLLNDTGWTKVSGVFVAAGDEAYLNITNFTPDNLSDTTFVGGGISNNVAAYYFIDDVSVLKLEDTIPPMLPISLTPSPNNGTMQLRGTFPAGTRIEFFDMLGQRVRQEDVPDGSTPFDIYAPELAAGMYLYRVVTNTQELTSGKIVIAR